MKSIGLVLIGVATTIVSLAVAWYIIIYLPAQDKARQAAETARLRKEETDKQAAKRELQFCLLQAQETYDTTLQYNSFSDPQPSHPDLIRWNSAEPEDRADKQLETDKALCVKEYPQS